MAMDLAQRMNQIISSEDNAAAVFNNPPRRLVSSNTVLQVVNGNTVKQRILLLFNDILVLAKPVHNDSSNEPPIMRLTEPMAVKHVVRLEELRVSDGRKKALNHDELQRFPAYHKFVMEFRQDPDMAVANLTKGNNDPAAVTWILFHSFELDKNQLGSYLSRRSSKHLLRAYIDHFGFSGVRIDQALRVFWISIRPPISQTGRDNLLQGFATRWFDANAQLVSFDRDLAMRLVSAIMQLNQILHPGNNPTDPFAPPVQVGAREFIDAFRRYDSRMLVSDDQLEHIHIAIQQERLATALDSSTNFPHVPVAISGFPNRLSYKAESDNIVVRIPRPDSNFSIQLIGQGLLFNPPILDFSRSAEASFKVTGTALGSKSMIMSRIGPHAPYYSGVPSSKPVTVERAFMRNTFHLTMPIGNTNREYLFSIDENQRGLVSQLEHHISENQSRRDSVSTNGSQTDGARQASEAIAFKVLCDSLMQGQGSPPMGGALLKRQLQQPQSQRTGKDIAVLCRQNSLLPSILIHAYGSPL
jgi:serine/arginine repetitive matrix protein 2